MSNYFTQHMADGFQQVHQSQLIDQSNLQDEANDEFHNNDCPMMADELSQAAPSNIFQEKSFNDKSFSNQTNYYVGNPTQMPAGDDDNILEDEELFEEEEVIGPSNLDVSETLEQDIGR